MCLILSTFYIVIPVSGCTCVDRGPCTLLCTGAYKAVKTALPVISCDITNTGPFFCGDKEINLQGRDLCYTPYIMFVLAILKWFVILLEFMCSSRC